MFQATRRRLALWYTAVTAVLLLLFAIGVYTYVRGTLVERVDDTLNHVVEIVERSLVIGNNGKVNIEASFRNKEETSEDDRIDLEWFGPEGNLQWTTFSKSPQVPLHVNPNGETITTPHGLAIRQITQRISIGAQLLGYLRVSHPWFEVSKPSRQLIIDLGFGITAMIATVAGIGWFLSGLAMAPIRTSYHQLKQFTADASHELRNPIAVIQTNVQVALADPDEQFQHTQLEVIERLTRRLGRLVDDLLFIARQESGLIPMRQEPIELVGLIEDVVEEQQAIAQEKNLTLTYTHAKTELSTQGDRDQLTRLFTNLIANAIQYTSVGTVSIDLSASAQQATITIADTGIGIPAQDLDHIFDRFYRVDPARSRSIGKEAGGSGLGLAIAKIIAENHHGQLTLTSQSNPATDHGTIATVLLPAKTAPAKKAETSKQKNPGLKA
ncbi:cell wall metabolism sensor histidine kinase WalK [cf. Phormidesmis sp. LEGE 11477]|uniref:sensor histidine kinase n=1 Tax=cf. Phormidesmis sp. LEGE 11477 TaxID=1828680 RepID=UPI00187EB59D|nr:HAMP domain-containing sensor histidine kinase [cf. Phormidesmis sp. LEGE 11477]MBE9062355.1 sensor histidine kinase [cf. Phormidesmis sp. LEGE 11477]